MNLFNRNRIDKNHPMPPPSTTPQMPKPHRPECKKTPYCKYCANCISYNVSVLDVNSQDNIDKNVICAHDVTCERFRLKGEF